MKRTIARKIISPLTDFLNDSRSIGITLLVSTAISLILANSSQGTSYIKFWQTEFHFLQVLWLPHSLLHCINDGLMTLFFFLAGMEIKREMLEGELATVKKSLLPVAAAAGGMVFPAVIYLLINLNGSYIRGWGIPTATDIAFSLGIASLLGSRVPVALKVFLTALAIIDDLGAILVIAVFYGEQLNVVFLAVAALCVLVITLLNRILRHFHILQFALGLALWFSMFNSGIHATIAGVIFAFLVPSNQLSSFEHKLHHLVYFGIMPVFVLANTCILLPATGFSVLKGAMPVGIMCALFFGKPLGITIASWLAIKCKKADMPEGANWKQMTGAGILAGIGFTMSIFISTLAFTEDTLRDTAKIAVLTASLVAMASGFAWLRLTGSKPTRQR